MLTELCRSHELPSSSCSGGEAQSPLPPWWISPGFASKPLQEVLAPALPLEVCPLGRTGRQAGEDEDARLPACAHSPGTQGHLLPRGAGEGTPLAPHARHSLPAPFAGLVSLSGNSLLLLVAYRKRSTLKPAEFFIVNLAVSDLSMTVTLFPLATPSFFAHR